MNKSKAQARRERHERERSEHAAQVAALRLVRDDPESTPGERLRATEILLKLEGEHYGQY